MEPPLPLNRMGSILADKSADLSSELSNKRAMFGDAFGSRGDYSKGFFYGGRRKVLQDPSPQVTPKKCNELELPEMFMTRKQTRKHRLQTEGIQFKLEFNVNTSEESNTKQAKQAVKKQEEKKSKKPLKSTIVVEHFSSTNPEDWSLKEQAGCKFYVNHKSGEATTEIPWAESPRDPVKKNSFFLPPISSSPIRQPINKPNTEISDPFECTEEGTGAFVYDGNELQSFLALLDQHCDARRKTKSRHK